MLTSCSKKALAIVSIAAGLLLISCRESKITPAADDATPTTRTISPAAPAEPPAQAAASALSTHGRPQELARMLLDARGVDPNGAWQKGIRTLTPFDCQLAQAGIVRCQTTFSAIGQDGLAAYLDVMIYDDDVTFNKEYADIKAMTAEKGDQAPFFTHTDISFVDGNGAKKTMPSECKQEIGTTANSPVNCFAPFDGSTELVAGEKASRPSTTNDGAKAEAAQDATRVFGILVLGTNLLNKLWSIPHSPTGDFKDQDVPSTEGNIMFSDPGWYVQRNDIFELELFAGPYADKKSCVEDLPRARASAVAQGNHGYATEECDYLQNKP